MGMSRREFLEILAVSSLSGLALPERLHASPGKHNQFPADIYEIPKYGNVSLLHFTDCHAQLLPVWFREPNVNIGVGHMLNKPPRLVGKHVLQHFELPNNSVWSYAHTYLNFEQLAQRYGKVGGFAHLATLVKQMRAQRPGSLLLDGGDTWQGSATSLWTQGQDMVDACLLLGVDAMTGHWEFTYGAERVRELVDGPLRGKIDFIAQNIIDTEWEERVFSPYVIKSINGVDVAIIGQAFPYTPIANPRYMVKDWSFGIREEALQQTIEVVQKKGAKVVALLSHNGMDVDLKIARRVAGIDAILGGHTHDALPTPTLVKNPDGKQTLVVNSGSNGKFLTVLDFDVRNGKIKGRQCKVLPILSNLLPPDVEMSNHIDKVRAPFIKKLDEKLAVADELLYRRGNFNGTFDQIILDAMIERMDTEIAFSPGFRWGTSKLPGEAITFEDIMNQTAITYPGVTRNQRTGERIKDILEQIADNIFHEDPYFQQGGDMVRVGKLRYSIDPTAKIGKRINDLTLNDKPLQANKKYVVGGWASVQENAKTEGPIWDIVADYLRDKKVARITELNQPILKNVANNSGYKAI